jgi:hypothetical protein
MFSFVVLTKEVGGGELDDEFKGPLCIFAISVSCTDEI